jgi:hypothetical protein
MLFLARSLQEDPTIDILVSILTEIEIKLEQLELIPHEFINCEFNEAVGRLLKYEQPKIIIYDLSVDRLSEVKTDTFRLVQKSSCFQIGIDNLLRYSDLTDFTLVPAFRINSRHKQFINDRVKWGWDTFLIPLPNNLFNNNNRELLVLTGSSDYGGYGNYLPTLLNEHLSADLKINWVQGPFARAPSIPQNPKHSWNIHVAPDGLGHLMQKCCLGLTVFGVSLFELISYQLPSVVLSPYNGKDDEDIMALEKDGIALYGANMINSIMRLNELATDEVKFHSIQKKCGGLMQKNGVNAILEQINSYVKK